jgi:dipeptidyl aminopeptidase/acylaminoacyl peptidase
VDVLNGMAAVKNLPQADPNRIGMWGHSMGGQITLRAMVVSNDIKAGVIWGGVVGSYPDLLEYWRRPSPSGPTPTPDIRRTRGRWRVELIETYGYPEENPLFWASISPNSYLTELSGPIQLHHATGDKSVPFVLSELLYAEMLADGMPVELHLYEGDDHDITANFDTAMTRSIQFFDTYVKGQG